MPAIGAVRPTAIIRWTKARRDNRPVLTPAIRSRSSRSCIGSAPRWCAMLLLSIVPPLLVQVPRIANLALISRFPVPVRELPQVVVPAAERCGQIAVHGHDFWLVGDREDIIVA